MIEIARSFEWDMGHRIPDHGSKCRNLHGHRYRLDVSVSGDVKNDPGASDHGMIADFGKLKGVVEGEIRYLDHAFMYWEKDAVMGDFAAAHADLLFVKTAYVPTAEEIVGDLANRLSLALATALPGITLTRLSLHETPDSRAEWRA